MLISSVEQEHGSCASWHCIFFWAFSTASPGYDHLRAVAFVGGYTHEIFSPKKNKILHCKYITLCVLISIFLSHKIDRHSGLGTLRLLLIQPAAADFGLRGILRGFPPPPSPPPMLLPSCTLEYFCPPLLLRLPGPAEAGLGRRTFRKLIPFADAVKDRF